MISVIIPLYNKEKQIVSTLQTVLNQSYQNFEIIIVDDGSTDQSVSEVEKIQDCRIRLIKQKNAGVSAARNRGLKEAKGDFIALLDADDEWNEDYLQTQIDLASKYTECNVFVTNYEFKDSHGISTPTRIKKLPFDKVDGILDNYFEVASCSHPPITSITIMSRKNVIESIGGFPEGIRSGEDLITWAKLAIKYKIAFSKKIMATFNFDEEIFNEDQKKRVPEIQDYVGDQLQILFKKNVNVKGLKAYVALWFKMRSHIYLNKGFRYLAIREALKSLRYRVTIKILIFLFLAFCPKIIIHKSFSI